MNPTGALKTILLTLLLITVNSTFPVFAALSDGSSGVVKIEGVASLKPVHPGSIVTVAIRLQIQEGWHVNAHEGLPEFFIPVELSLNPGTPVQIVGPIRYPSGSKKKLAGETLAFSVYERAVTFYADVKLSPDVKPGRLALRFLLKIQACNDRACLSPSTVKIGIPVEAGAIDQPVTPIHPEYFQNGLSSQTDQAPPENIISQYLKSHGILLTFILIFLGGLALNLTPCVYPMIPITISYFGNQKAEKPRVILGRAVAYVVGISVTYSALGVTAALTGRILGSTLQSPLVLMGISAVLVLLSFSMFGLYEIQAPDWLLNRIASTSTQGWIGALGMGLVFGIVAAPCVDPFSIGLLTFVAAKANPYLGFIMFFTLSLGLGFPYVWLGFFSNEIQRLPRSGMWMVWVKKVFGLVLLGMPFYFLGPLMPKNLNHYLVSIYLVLSGILLAWVFSGKGVTLGFKKFQNLFGILLILSGALVFKIWPQPIELPFVNYDPVLLEKAQKEHQQVLIDFSAGWCLPCKELEMKTFPDAGVREALKDWVLLKADLTQYSSGSVEELKRAYGIQGVPTLVFIGPDGSEKKALRIVGFVRPMEFLSRIQQASN
jgi:thiol:disulfide interchange protein DsbD